MNTRIVWKFACTVLWLRSTSSVSCSVAPIAWFKPDEFFLCLFIQVNHALGVLHPPPFSSPLKLAQNDHYRASPP